MQHSEIDAAVILPHSKEAAFRICFEEEQHWFWEGAALKILGSIQALALKKSNIAHLKVDFFLQFLPIKFCILESCWKNCLKLIPKEVYDFFHWKFSATLGFSAAGKYSLLAIERISRFYWQFLQTAIVFQCLKFFLLPSFMQFLQDFLTPLWCFKFKIK